MSGQPDRWQFAIDRGGTFTDVVAWRPDGRLVIHKLLSENPERYQDAVLQGIRDVLGLEAADPIPAEQLASVKIGTTVATNALLERTGDRTVLVITEGFGDALRIGYQNRPDIFARRIVLPARLYERVVEAHERVTAQGEVLTRLDAEAARGALETAYADGIRACAIVLLHGYRYPGHERQVADLARAIGFTQISISHDVAPVMRLVSRGDTTVVDAYLSPLLNRYLERIANGLPGTRVMLMQSSGGLIDARAFRAKNSLLSGPAGGVVGAVRVGEAAGFDRIIGFDMGGTSTDVSHYRGEFERAYETEIAGVRLRSPIMAVHTVAAGGGSILHFDGSRYRVGPDSAGAHPGPACYRKGGPLTVTDANVMVGKIRPDSFPRVFGPRGDLPLDAEVVRRKFAELAAEIRAATGDARTPEQVAQGFLAIAVENMTNAIKRISIQQGHDVTEYTLVCFGGAGGQHACQIAGALGMTRVLIHPYAGVLSAYGIGVADLRATRERTVEAKLEEGLLPALTRVLDDLSLEGASELRQGEGSEARVRIVRKAHLRYEGTDSPLVIDFGSLTGMWQAFEEAHRQRYGFTSPEKDLIVETASVEVIQGVPVPRAVRPRRTRRRPPQPVAHTRIFTADAWWETPVYAREEFQPGDVIAGPAIIVEATGTDVLEPGWQAEVTARGDLLLSRVQALPRAVRAGTKADPVLLEVFNGLFRSVADQMGVALQNTAHSVNIKERLDFSCAIFDGEGRLVAAAQHIPVHLGSMSESVRALLAERVDLRPGDAYVTNNPYRGGTHLPDVTVITPVFDDAGERILFFAASRGHHADIGGITPGSMPPHSRTLEEEGVVIEAFPLVRGGRFREQELVRVLASARHPARSPVQNVADLQAQVAANERGAQELRRLVASFGLPTVRAYMGHVRENAAESVRRALVRLADQGREGRSFVCELDDGARLQVSVRIDRAGRRARVDFTGTSPQHAGNFNAPTAVGTAAVLYVFRTLVDDDVPLNSGCLEPIDVLIPAGCLLDPRPPAAVVAGNVETSQLIVDALYGALGVMAGSQGTMNNFTFGTGEFQYYETICGGTGAGPDFEGADAVHSHMTNTRLTDPEVLEWRFPVLVECFAIRRGSGGEGRHRGGDGVVRRLRFRTAATAAILSSRRRAVPHGLLGGAPGAAGVNRVERADGTIESLPGTASAQMHPGDMFVIETPGGGGYGAPEPAASPQRPRRRTKGPP